MQTLNSAAITAFDQNDQANPYMSSQSKACIALIREQIVEKQNPLNEISDHFTNSFVAAYSEYTGSGSKLSKNDKKGLIRKISRQSIQLQKCIREEEWTQINVSEAFHDVDDVEGVYSVGNTACDELYLIIRTFCQTLEAFYAPFLPIQANTPAASEMHLDCLKLSEDLIFSKNQTAKTIQILLRVDTQLDDAGIRKKCRYMRLNEFTTGNFGIPQELQLINCPIPYSMTIVQIREVLKD